jgi:hypothetical protein
VAVGQQEIDAVIARRDFAAGEEANSKSPFSAFAFAEAGKFGTRVTAGE